MVWVGWREGSVTGVGGPGGKGEDSLGVAKVFSYTKELFQLVQSVGKYDQRRVISIEPFKSSTAETISADSESNKMHWSMSKALSLHAPAPEWHVSETSRTEPA